MSGIPPGCDDLDVMLDELEIHPVARADGVELRVSGELTLETAGQLASELAEAERSRADLLVLDLRDVRFIDSTGLAALVAARKRSVRDGRRLILVIAPGTIQRLLELTGLIREFDTVAARPAATTRTGAPSTR
jgi:anti-sigma B factor antagonist